ncbi:MAG TPA: DUF4388 domain-containing protein [Pyrinomonadaceae bacterium]|nr:DUF4388 domain-containing protein [Pyrinomonadaceae bacterium]
MENIERTQFAVLAGHLDEQSLPDLMRALRVQRKTGRLRVEYADGPASFFFDEGQLVDAQLGSLRGVEAVYAALSLEGASFNFNPLVKPPEQNIDKQGRQFIEDLIESPRREGLAEIDVARGEFGAARGASDLPRHAPLQLPPAAEIIAPLQERLSAVEEAIVSTAHRFSRERLIYAVVIGFLVGLSFITTLSVARGPLRFARAPAAQATPAPPVNPNAADAQPLAADATRERAASQPTPNASRSPETISQKEKEQPPVPSTAALIATRRAEGVTAQRGGYVVQVLVEVRSGTVTDARVWNPRPGAAAYEAVALRMARERRYPEDFSGSERLKIMVSP